MPNQQSSENNGAIESTGTAVSNDPPLVLEFLQVVLRNVSQVVLQNNAISGVMILVALFYNSIPLGMAAVIGSVVSTITAMLLKADRNAVRAGLYGFNAVLTAMAIQFYVDHYDTIDISLGLLILYQALGAVFSAIIGAALGNLTSRWDVPPLTAPFVLASWLFVAATLYSPALAPGHHENIDTAVPVVTEYSVSTWTEGIGKGFGEVFFEDNAVSGYLILLAIFVNSRISGGAALIGAVVSILIAELLNVNALDVNMGMYSYSAILTAIALGGLFVAPNLWGWIYMVLGVMLTTWMYPSCAAILGTVHIPVYTTTFILATWLMMFARDSFANIVRVPLAEATIPENHFGFLKTDR